MKNINQSKGFTLSDVERDAVDGADLAPGFAKDAFVGLVDLDQVADGEQGHGMNPFQDSKPENSKFRSFARIWTRTVPNRGGSAA